MRVARIFLNPHGEKWVDFGLADQQTMPNLWNQISMEGGIFGGVAAVPRETIHHLLVFEVEQAVVPGGKPN
jgi:hypothetical protein